MPNQTGREAKKTPDVVLETSVFQCRNCDGRECRPVYRDLPDRLCRIDGRFTYVRCLGCGLIQLRDIPANLAEFYADYRPHCQASAIYSLFRKVLLGHCYRLGRGGGRALLDIGCGDGWYVREMADKGWRAVGYEFDQAYADRLADRLGIEILADQATLGRCADQFDRVTMHFCFEHLTHPVHMVDLAGRCLKAGGEIAITVPNIDSAEARTFGDRWFHLDPPRHISFFTKELLGDLLRRKGFADVRVRPLPIATGFAGSMVYRIAGSFQPLIWYAAIPMGIVFSWFIRDGNFAVSARKT